MVSVNTAQLILTAFTYLVAIWIGWAAQMLRDNGLADTRRELRRAYREYDELLTLLHTAPVVEEVRGGAPSIRPSEVERPRAFTVIRGEGA